jgi:hypothetical protein
MCGSGERWIDHVKNEDALQTVKGKKKIVHAINKGRTTGLVISFVGTAF